MNNWIKIDTKNITEARKLIDKYIKSKKELKIAVASKSDEFNRMMIESCKINLIYGFEFENRKDRLKQRESGLNHILCKLATDNNIKIGIDFSEIMKKKDFSRAVYLGKIMQNIKLCKKNKVKMILVNVGKWNKLSLFSFLLTLGMPTNMSKYAVDNLVNID